MQTNDRQGDKPHDQPHQDATTDSEATTNWDAVGFVVASTYRQQTMRALDSQPQTPSQIAERTDEGISHISRALSDLQERGFVTLLVPEERKKGRIYGLTDEGRQLVQAVPDGGDTPHPHAGGGSQ